MKKAEYWLLLSLVLISAGLFSFVILREGGGDGIRLHPDIFGVYGGAALLCAVVLGLWLRSLLIEIGRYGNEKLQPIIYSAILFITGALIVICSFLLCAIIVILF